MRWAWEEQAACRNSPADLWFPELGDTGTDAKRVCRRCPVRQECLDAHLFEKFGVYGGMTEKERRHERRRRSLAGEAA